MVENYFNYNIYHFKTTHIYTDNCALLSYYAASSGNSVPTFGTTYLFHLQGSRIKQILTGFLILEDGTDRRSRNVGKELQLLSE